MKAWNTDNFNLNESYSDFKEQTFSTIFKNYDKFEKQKIAEFEKEEIDYED